MAEAKVRSLTIRPFQSADLAFNESGILDIQNAPVARLGVRVDAFNLQDLYSRLGRHWPGMMPSSNSLLGKSTAFSVLATSLHCGESHFGHP